MCPHELYANEIEIENTYLYIAHFACILQVEFFNAFDNKLSNIFNVQIHKVEIVYLDSHAIRFRIYFLTSIRKILSVASLFFSVHVGYMKIPS